MEKVAFISGANRGIGFETAKKLAEKGIKVILKGKPNAGKSSIFNSIIKKQKAIVSSIPGTTRDIIEGKINFKGHAIIFYDTAGITITDNEIEKEGIKRTKKLSKLSLLHDRW